MLGCDMMSTPHRIDHMSALPISCDSNAGSYSLPKSFVKLTVIEAEKDAETGRPKRYELQTVKQIRREDPQHTYCLKYRGSITADDKIFVRKARALDEELIEDRFELSKQASPAQAAAAAERLQATRGTVVARKTNLLQVVSTDAIDQSGFIAQTLIKTLFRGAAGTGGRGGRSVFLRQGDKDNVVLDIEFDPFNPWQTAAANDALNDLGFCVILGGYTFNLHEETIENYCDQPVEVLKTKGKRPMLHGRFYDEALLEYEKPLAKLPRGILYRPEMSYTLYVFGNQKDGRFDFLTEAQRDAARARSKDSTEERWNLRVKQVLQMENISPIVAVRVSRTYFAQRQTNLVFIGGVLKNVCIAKTSELLEISKLPLVVVQSIVALPTEIVELRLKSASNDAALLAAQQRLIDAQLNYLNALTDPDEKAVFKDIKPTPSASSTTTGLEPIPAQKPNGELGTFDAGEANNFACPHPDTLTLVNQQLQNPGNPQ